MRRIPVAHRKFRTVLYTRMSPRRGEQTGTTLNKSQQPKRRPRAPGPASGRSDDRRTKLIDTAIAMFTLRPYAEVSIEELAAEAGVAKGLLYYYFGDKRGLYVAALQQLAGALRDRLAEAEAITEADPLTRLRHGLDVHLSFIERYTAGYRELMSSIGLYPELREIVEEGQRITIDLIMSNIPPEVPRGPALELAVNGWGGFVDRAELTWLADPKADRDQVLELCARMIVSAITTAIEVDRMPRGDQKPAERPAGSHQRGAGRKASAGT